VEQPIGERIADIARREIGNHACGPNKVDGGGYFSSCVNHQAHEEWCADFARWVWAQAHVLNADMLTPAAGSFGKYGAVRQDNPRVGDAVLFGYDGISFARHVAIVVSVQPGDNIVSVGGNEGNSEDTSVVSKDGPYLGTFNSFAGPNSPLSGYVSPVEDDMPFTQQEIVDLVKQGVNAELSAGPSKAEILGLVKQGVAAELTAVLGTTGVSAAQGAKAAVDADTALAAIAQQLTALTAQVAALAAATPPTTGTGQGTGTGGTAGTGQPS
jgi:hypothetical protein